MAPGQVPAVRSLIASTRLAEAQEMTARVLVLRSEHEVEELVMTTMRQRLPSEFAAESVL